MFHSERLEKERVAKEQLADMVERFPPDVQAYFRDALSEGYPLTLTSLTKYAVDFHVFWLRYCQPKGITKLEQVTADVMRGFPAFLHQGYQTQLRHIVVTRTNCEVTINTKKAALRTIFGYLKGTRHIYEHDPSTALSEHRTRRRGGAKQDRLPIYLNAQETTKLIEVVSEGKERRESQQWLNLRDFTIIAIFTATAIRVSELLDLEQSSFSSDLNLVRVTGKGSKTRSIPLTAELQQLVSCYLEYRRQQPLRSQALFLNRSYRPLTHAGVYKIVKEWTTKANLLPYGQSVSPHKLRHTAATNWYQRGLDVYHLQLLLGHAQIGTTLIYTHIAPRDLINEVKRIEGIDNDLPGRPGREGA